MQLNTKLKSFQSNRDSPLFLDFFYQWKRITLYSYLEIFIGERSRWLNDSKTNTGLFWTMLDIGRVAGNAAISFVVKNDGLELLLWFLLHRLINNERCLCQLFEYCRCWIILVLFLLCVIEYMNNLLLKDHLSSFNRNMKCQILI